MAKDANASPGNKAAGRLYGITCKIAVAFLIVQIIVVSYIVFGRYVLSKSPAWGEELSLLCMVWFSLLSASIAEYNGAHIKVDLNKYFLPPWALRTIAVANHLIKIVFSVIMIIEGFRLVFSTKIILMPGLNVSVGLLYLSVPLAGIFLLFSVILRSKEVLKWETR